jgi:hypothetical protein
MSLLSHKNEKGVRAPFAAFPKFAKKIGNFAKIEKGPPGNGVARTGAFPNGVWEREAN